MVFAKEEIYFRKEKKCFAQEEMVFETEEKYFCKGMFTPMQKYFEHEP